MVLLANRDVQAAEPPGGAGLHFDRDNASADLQYVVHLGIAVFGLADPGEQRGFLVKGPQALISLSPL